MEAQIVYLHHLMMGAYCLAGLFGGVSIICILYLARMVHKVRRLVRDVSELQRHVRTLLRDEGVEVNWHQGQSEPPPAFR